MISAPKQHAGVFSFFAFSKARFVIVAFGNERKCLTSLRNVDSKMAAHSNSKAPRASLYHDIMATSFESQSLDGLSFASHSRASKATSRLLNFGKLGSQVCLAGTRQAFDCLRVKYTPWFQTSRHYKDSHYQPLLICF